MATAHKTFSKVSTIPASAEAVYAWHTSPEALLKLTPPWIHCQVTPDREGIHNGNRVLLHICRGLISFDWLAEQCNVEESRRFDDIQVSGPFGYWHHVHLFTPISSGQSLLEDTIEYDLKLKHLLNRFSTLLVEPDLDRLFAFRHGITIAQFSTNHSTSVGTSH